MTWLALADPVERRFSYSGIGRDRQKARLHPEVGDYLLTRGSIVFELRIQPQTQPHVLLGFTEGWPDQRSLTFQAIPGGGVSLVQVEGQHIAHAAVQHIVPSRTDVLRVTFSWDAPKAFGLLTVERPEEHKVTSSRVQNIRPIPLQSLRKMILGQGDAALSDDLVFCGLSDAVEPVGPTPSLSPDAMVLTPAGYVPIKTLKRGDTVVSRGGDVVPVLHSLSRSVPARGSFAPIRLRAPYFGLLDEVVVSPEQRLVIDGSEVEYLFNEEAVLVPSRHLINGFAGREVTMGPVVRYTQLILPAHEAMIVAGTSFESLYIGRIRRKADFLAATLMRDLDRNSLPEHGRASFKELKWFDSIHLARQRAA